MAIRDVDLSTRQTHIWVSSYQALYPHDNLFPHNNLFPSDKGTYLSDNIVAGTMNLDELIVDGEEIIFGNLYSTKFEVQVYGDITIDGQTVSVGNYDFSGKYIYVFQEDNGVYKQLFTGKVDTCKKNRDGYDKQLVAYDSAYLYYNQNVAPWWEAFWTAKGEGASATLGEIRGSLLDYLAVNYARVSLPNDSVSIKKTVALSSFSFGTCLRMLCEINCCFPHFGRDNILDFIVLDPESTAKNVEALYEGPSTTFEEYTTQEITGIQFLNSDGEFKHRVGSATNVYTVSADNILLLDCTTADLTTIGNNMLSYVDGLVYKPCNIKMIVGDLSYNLGDRLITSEGTHYILHSTYSGTQFCEQQIECRGQQFIKEAGRTIDTTTMVLNQRIARVVVNVEEFETEFAEYTEGADARMSSLEQTIDGFTLTATAGDMKSTLKLTSGGVEIASEDISFTGAVSFTDLSTTGGSTVINGGNITTGSISFNDYNYWDIDHDRFRVGNSGSYIMYDSSGQADIFKIYYDKDNYWNLTNGEFNVSNVNTTRKFGIYADATHFQLFYQPIISGVSQISNHWYLHTGDFRIGGPTNTSPHIKLASAAAGADFQIYSDASNYWDLKTGTFKTTHGIFTGTVTTVSGDNKTVMEAGKLNSYYNDNLVGYVNAIHQNNHGYLYVGGGDYTILGGSGNYDGKIEIGKSAQYVNLQSGGGAHIEINGTSISITAGAGGSIDLLGSVYVNGSPI